MATDITLDELFWGHVTVGERGQVVIPAEARKFLRISPGDKLLVFRHPLGHGVLLTKIDTMQECMTRLMESLQFLQSCMEQHTPKGEEG
jgi:AbrB family looped-hinge helix DNA binding protein